MKKIFSAIVLFFLLLSTTTLFAKIYFVNSAYTGSTVNGNSWATPFKKLDDAIAAATDGDEIWVAKGTYTAPTYKSASGYFINNSLSIYGGFAGTETSIYARNLTLNTTVLQAAGSNGSYQILINLKQNETFLLDGVDLTNYGVGVLGLYDTIAQSNNFQAGDRYKLTINNCDFFDAGEAISFNHHTDLVITNSTFKNLSSTYIYISESSVPGDEAFQNYSTVQLGNSDFNALTSIMYCVKAQFEAVNCTVNLNNNGSTAFASNQSMDWSFKGCSFTNCNQVLAHTSDYALTIDDCIFDNFGSGGELFYINSSNPQTTKVSNSFFRNASGGNQMFYCGDLELDNVTFTNLNLNYQGINSSGTLTIKNSTIDGIKGISESSEFLFSEGNVNIQNCTFQNNALRLLEQVNATGNTSISNCLFQNNKTAYVSQRSDMMSLVGNINIDSSQFLNNTYTSNLEGYQYGLISVNSTGSGQLVLSNSTFQNNTTSNTGGIIYNQAPALEITNCLFQNNASIYPNPYFGSAGAVYSEVYSSFIHKVTNTKFIGNTADTWGAFCSKSNNIQFTNCSFEKNTSTTNTKTSTGALMAYGITSYVASYLSLVNTSFIGNQTNMNAGALYTASGNATIDACIFKNNKSSLGASAIENNASILKISNSLFDGNMTQGTNVGTVYLSTTTQAPFETTDIINSTFVNNKAQTGADVLVGTNFKSIVNSIFWQNGIHPPLGLTLTSVIQLTVKNSDIQGGFNGTNIYDTDPKFVDFVNGNYRLSCQSPIINKGDNTYTTTLFDLDGTARIFADTVDIGAYETHIDPATATTAITPAFTIPASVCKAEVINVVNTTANVNNYLYRWDFGNAQTSTQVNPSYSYLQEGTYTVQLTASDFCGQSNSTTKQITVKSINAPTISTASVMCPGSDETYTTDATCQSLVWTVVGGSILSGQGTTAIHVLWGDGSTGNGKITLLATGCGTGACEIPVSIDIPIVPVNVQLTGNQKVCQGGFAHYGTIIKDHSPATLFTWTIKGGTISTTSNGYNLTDIDVQWDVTDTSGVIYLTTYNELLKCGSTDSLVVKIRPAFKVTGTTEVCTSSSANYQVSATIGTVLWTVTGNNTITSGSVSWGSDAGTYQIIAKPQDPTQACVTADTLVVNVHAIPVITAITGETELAVNDVENYTAQTSAAVTDLTFNWSSVGGTVLSFYSNTAVIQRNSFSSGDNVALTVTTTKGSCSSTQFVLPITPRFIYAITGLDTVCIGDTKTYTANVNPLQSAAYQWTSSLNTTTNASTSVDFTFNNPNLQQIQLLVTSNGKEYNIVKNVFVKSSPSTISVEGPVTIDPAGVETATYTVKSPANTNYDFKIVGGTVQNKTGNVYTVKWGGTDPFAITVTDIFASACSGVPVTLNVNKATQLSSGIIASKPACLNARVDYSYNTDEFTKNLVWSLNGGGSITSSSSNAVSIEWNQTGTHILTLTYDRFGTQVINTTIIVNSLPQPVINSGTICGTNNFNLSTTQNYVSYSWFADSDKNAFSTLATPPVIKEGMYSVNVTDNNGCSNYGSQYIKQIPLPKATVFSRDNLVVCADATSAATTNISLSTFEGQDYTYQWYLNNTPISGATSFTIPVNQPLNQATYYTYKVKVTLETCEQISGNGYVSVTPCGGGSSCTEAPVAFTVDQSSLCQPFKFQQTAGPTDELGWDFGDETSYLGAIPPDQTYLNAGVYTVSLTRRCQSYKVPVEVFARSLFKLDQPGCVGQNLQFNDLSVNVPWDKITAWTWNFGDGTGDFSFTGSGNRDQTHTFNNPGTYTVTLKVTATNLQGKECTYISSNNYTISTPPPANIIVKAPSCTDNTYQFIADTTGIIYDRGVYAWTFSNGQTSTKDTTFQQFTSGNQSAQLKVTDLLGCTNTKTTALTVAAPNQVGSITVTSTDTLLCNSRTVTLTSPLTANTTSYTWKKDGATIGGNTQNLTVTAPGKYTVTYSPALGCSGTTAAIQINSFTVPNLISGSQNVCAGDVLTLKSNLNAADLNFSWKQNTTTLPNNTGDLILNNITTTQSGNYQLTVTQKVTGCTYTLPNYSVIVNNVPAKPILNVAALNICYNSSAKLNTPTTKAGKTFSWFENSALLTATDTAITTGLLKSDASYYVTVKSNATGCMATSETVKIKIAPSLDFLITGDTVVCEQSSAELKTTYTGTDFDFQWYKNNQPYGGNFSKLTFSAIALADSGLYKLTVTSKGTTNLLGCQATSNTKKIKVKPAAITPVITGTTVFCSGGSVTLTSNLTSNFIWSTGAKTPAITITSGGIYSVTATNPLSGCTITTAQTVTQNPTPDLNFVPEGDYTRCATNKISFEGLNQYPYQQWFVNGVLFSTQKVIYPTLSGKYTLQATSDKGCTAISDTMNITSQECPCYVTNTNDTGDGSFREAINCSNNKPGKDVIKFSIAGTGPFVIKPVTALPILTDSVLIDGFSQSGVNVYAIALDGSLYSNSNGLVIGDKLAHVTISGLTFTKFNTSVVLSSGVFNNTIQNNIFTGNTNTGTSIAYGANNNLISNNQYSGGVSGIDFLSGSYQNTIQSNAITAATNAILFDGGTNNIVRSNTISASSQNGVLIKTGSGNKIVSNTIGTSLNNGVLIASGAPSNNIDSNYIGITPSGTIVSNQQNGIYVAPNASENEISNNTIGGNTLSGILNDARLTTIKNNLIGVDALNNAKPNATYGVYSNADSIIVIGNKIANNNTYGLLIQDSSLVKANTIQNNISGGIYVTGLRNKITQNVIANSNSSVKAINLHFSTSPVGNSSKTPAVFKSYRRAADGGIILKGTSAANDSVEIFYNNNIAQQALIYAGSTKADATGIWQIEIPQGPAFNPNQQNYYVNTATAKTSNGKAENTSELSSPFLTGCFSCICTVTNTNDSGAGSLRAIIDEANLGGCLTINFSMTTADTIKLASALSPITVPVNIIAPVSSTSDPLIFIKGSPSFNGLIANADGVQINNLGFTNFKQAVVFNSDYNTLHAATIINSTRPVTIAGNNSQLISNAINTTWANDASTFKADTLVYITGNGNQIGGTGVGNKITNGSVAGVLVNGGTSNSILNNDIYTSTTAIKLVNNGNNNYTKPTSIVGAINGSTATIQGTAKPYDKIQIFSSNYEPEQALGFAIEVTADASGNWTATLPPNLVDVTKNNYFVVTATSTTGNTSQLSPPIRVGNLVQVCYVTNTNNAGDGSLREAVNCANIAGTDPNGVAARIEFLLPAATQNVITLTSELLITNNYGVAVNARSIPVTVNASNAALNGFNWATNNFQVKNLSFTNFNNALNCTGKNAVVDSNNFVNNKNAIYISAVDSLTQQIITNNYFAGGTGSINSVKGSLYVAGNTFGLSKTGTSTPITGFGISAMHAGSVQIANNTFQNISESGTAITPASSNGYVINIENASSTITSNKITGDNTTLLSAIRLYSNTNSTVAANILNTAYDGILFDRCDFITVSQNAFTKVSDKGFNLSRSNRIKLTQNTVVGLAATKKPIDLNLATGNVSNGSKQTPSILTSTYHDGELFLIGTAEQYDEVEVFYSNSNQLDLVKYIEAATADSTGTWIVSFPIPAAGSDTLFFRAVSTKSTMLSSEASVAFTPQLKICLVTTNADAGTGSLRDAINKANLNQCNLIQFAIPGSGVAQIRTSSELPIITTSLLIIDGTSQTGYVTGSPTVAVINNATYGFNGQNGDQLDIYGMQLVNFDVAITITNSKIVDVNDNIIQDFTDTGLKVTTTTFKYGNVINNTFKATNPANTAISLSGTNEISITKNRISGFQNIGIDTKGNNQKIINNRIVSTDSMTSVGISVNNSSGVLVQQDTIGQAGTGIRITNGNANQLESNTIGLTDSTSKANKLVVKNYGISVTGSNNCNVVTNTLNGNAIGIAVANCKSYYVYSNTTNKISDKAIYLSTAPNGQISNNTIDSASIGMQFDNSHGVIVYNNLITRSLQYGAILNTGSDTCKLTANLIGARYVGDPTYAAGAGVLVKSSNNYIGPDKDFGLANYIKQNKGGGVIVDGGVKNRITYNYFYNNDISKGKPTNYAIALINSGNNGKQKPSITANKWISGKLHLYGTNNGSAGDSIHLYLGTGGYEETSKYLGRNISQAGGSWEVIVDTSVIKIAPRTTLYLVATATDANRNTSPLSDMYIMGDCYITSLKDTTDNIYPLPNTMRMAMKCANGQSNSVGVYFNVAQGGAKEVKLQMKMQDLNNHYGVYFDGKNIPDGNIASMNAQNMNITSWTIASTNAKSSINNFSIVNAQNGLELLSDSILVQNLEFDRIKAVGVLVSNKYNTINSCVFDSLSVGIQPASNAVKTILTGNTFNQTTTGVEVNNVDSLAVAGNTFNKNVFTGIDINQSTHAAIYSNTFNSNIANSQSINWDNTKGIINGNTFTARNVQNPVAISNASGFEVKNNSFNDSAYVYLSVSNSFKGLIDSNSFSIARQNSIQTNGVQHLSIIGNDVSKSQGDAFNLQSSSTVFISKNIVTQVRYTSKTDSALCINIHKGDAVQSNNGKVEPKNLSYEVKNGPDRRKGIFVKGTAQPNDSIQIFFSDSISASMNQYIVNTYTQPDGTWEVKIPRQFYYHDTITWYHCIAVAIAADSTTSQTSSVLHIPPSPTKIYVLNEYDAGPNSLRQALLDVTYSDLYSQVIFSINTPTVKPGPYNIKIDSLFDPVYSYLGFKMDGETQEEFVGMGPDQRIFVNGKNIGNNFGLDITDSSEASLLKNMWMSNARNGLRISNKKNQIESFNFINTDSSGVSVLDTAFVVQSDENKIKNIDISGYNLGVLFQKQVGKNEFTLSNIDSTAVGVALTDSSYSNYIATTIFTNTTTHAIWIDSAAADNKIEKNIFGKQGLSVKGNVITINNSNNQTFNNNRISYVDANPTQTGSVSVVLIQGNSSQNLIYANRIGLDSLGSSVHTADLRGITIQSTSDGVPVANSILGNEINGMQRASIYVYNSSQDVISENIIGGDSSKHIYGIDTTAILISNSKLEQINDNIISGYSQYGIELLTSTNIQMHRNVAYSRTTNNKAINIHADNGALASNGSIVVPTVTEGTLIDTSSIRVRGTGIPGATIEVYQSTKDTVQSIGYIDKVTADGSGGWEILVPRLLFSFAKLNSFVAQNHTSQGSSELSGSYTPLPMLCQLVNNNPSLRIIDPKYTPCPGPKFNIDPSLDDDLHYAWKAPIWTDSIKVKKIQILDTTMNLVLKVTDDFGCTLVQQTDVIFKGRPIDPNFIISSNVYAKDTIVLVDVSMPVPDSYTWYSSPGVTVLRSSATAKDSLIGDDGNVYPKGTRFIQFILPDSGSYSIRQTSIRDGCFVDQTKTLNALPKDPNVTNPYYVAPQVESMYTYPNPGIAGSDVFVNITAASKDPVTLSLFTEDGQLIGTGQLSGKVSYDVKLLGTDSSALLTNDLASATYILKLTTAQNESIVFKMVIK